MDAKDDAERGAEEIEAAAEAMWNAYLASPICREEYQGVTWQMIRDGAKDRPRIKDVYETGLSEARAALLAAARIREVRAEDGPDDGELLPCPFCGAPAERIDIEDGENAGGSCISCTRCQASSNVEFEFKENFISNWNRRVIREAQGYVLRHAPPKLSRRRKPGAD